MRKDVIMNVMWLWGFQLFIQPTWTFAQKWDSTDYCERSSDSDEDIELMIPQED